MDSIFIYYILIYACVNNKNWLQPFLTDFECPQIFLMGMVPFPLFSVNSFILRNKNSGDQKKSSCEVDLFFLNRYTSVLTKKNYCSHLLTNFERLRVFFTGMVFFSEFPWEAAKFSIKSVK